jgi:methyl coenzyme M reductase subunit C-like uncharacterized protein (methanogenesis marker protein 7)
MGFHTFTLTENRCVWLLVEIVGKDMHENVVREELESLDTSVLGVTQLLSSRRGQDLASDHPPTPQLIVSVARGTEVSKVRTITELFGL